MVARERASRHTCSYAVQCKGVGDQHAAKRLVAYIKELGYESSPLVIKCDQESAVVAVAKMVTQLRGGTQTFIEHSPVRSSGSNGVIERGIKESSRGRYAL